MPSIDTITAALFVAALFAGAIACFLRAHEGPSRKVYSVDKRPIPVRIRAFFRRSK